MLGIKITLIQDYACWNMKNIKSNNTKTEKIQKHSVNNSVQRLKRSRRWNGGWNEKFTICSERECETVSAIIKCYRIKRHREVQLKVLKELSEEQKELSQFVIET